MRGSEGTLNVGRADDPVINDRIARFKNIKSDFNQRREMVRSLTAIGLPFPDPITGDVVEAMGRAGFFRLRGVLVGTVAFQCYSGILGVKLGTASLKTQDVDFAQFWGIAENIDNAMTRPLHVLQKVDETFHPLPQLTDPFVTTRYGNRDGFKVEFLTPNRGSERHDSRPAKMKVLSGGGAQPLRHLDYLIHHPEHSVLLHRGGVAVTVPRAERYAVHKLIVAVERIHQAKSGKDIAQAGALIEVLLRVRPYELAEAWHEAVETGEQWRRKLMSGRMRLPEDIRKLMDANTDLVAANKVRVQKKSKLASTAKRPRVAKQALQSPSPSRKADSGSKKQSGTARSSPSRSYDAGASDP